MNRWILTICLLFSAAWAQDASSPAVTDLKALAFFEGRWTAQSGPMTIEEHWMSPTANLMVGMGRTSRDGRGRFFEFLRIVLEKDGSIYYVAQPAGNPPTKFKLVKHSADEVIFENPQHDFPQRILYRRVNAAELYARVESLDGKKAEEFRYRRLP